MLKSNPTPIQGPRSETGRPTVAPLPSSTLFEIGTKAQNLRGTMPRFSRQDVAYMPLTPRGLNSNSR